MPASPIRSAALTPDARIPAARRAVRLVFLVNGSVLAGWAPLVPVVQGRLGLNAGELGVVLLCLGIGAILAMPATAPLIARLGSRAPLLVGGGLFCLCLPLLPLAPSGPLLGLGLFLLGASNGVLDVTMNAQAVLVEHRSPRPVMSSIHAIFSLGGLLGAGLMSLALRLGLPPLLGALLLSAAALALLLAQAPALLPRAEDSPPQPGGSHLALPRGPLLAIGLLCTIAYVAEGAMMDWSAVFLVQARGLEHGPAGLGFALFSLAMAAGRLAGDRLTARLGAVRMLRLGALLACAGFLAAVVLPWAVAGLAGFLLVGLGLSNIVPLLFSAAGRLPGHTPGQAIAAVATLGYAGLLAGPAVIGFVAQLLGLPLTLAGLGLLLLAPAARAQRLRQR